MNHTENLINILVRKSKLSRIKIDQLLENKIKKIGAKYLSLQGSVFLVASDLKITLHDVRSITKDKDKIIIEVNNK